MMKDTGAIVRVDLHGEEADDGRILVRSPDLEGFYFVVKPGEDPMTAMEPTLVEFMRIYLRAKVRRIRRAETPRQFRHKALGITRRPPRDYSVFAEVAAA